MHSTASLVRTYKQLTSEQRYQLSALKRMGHSLAEIAKEFEVHKSTMSRELRRNVGERGYHPKQANEKALERRVQSTSKKRISAETWKVVEEKLRQDWSPEKVSGWLRKRQEIRISHEWIYNTHGHKLRFPPSEKAQFVTECGISTYFGGSASGRRLIHPSAAIRKASQTLWQV